MIEHLTDSDIGYWVKYIPTSEKGKIKGFNNEMKIAFVVYNCDDRWGHFKNYTGSSTNYEDLEFTNSIAILERKSK